jgi:hypothetical protein
VRRLLRHQPDRTLSHFRRKTGGSWHGSNLSRYGASGNPGAIHLYTIIEPKSWAAIETGLAKLLQANPALMTTAYMCAGHSDNLITEIVVR